MSKSRLKVGVVGIGIGRAHLEGYLALADEVEVVALCDLDKTRLKAIGQEYNVPLQFADFDLLFQSGEIEAVSICLPNNLHARACVAALEAGIHVLCEKPLADTLASAQTVVEAAGRASSKFMICYNRRYRADLRWIKDLLSREGLGQIYQVKAGWIRETGIPMGWFTQKAVSGGGSLIDLGIHMLDAALWLLDYPSPLTVSGEVRAKFGPQGEKIWLFRSGQPGTFDVEDSAMAFVRLAGGVTLTVETSWASHNRPGLDDFFITLMGTQGTVELYVANYATENTLTLYTEINGVPVVSWPAVKSAKSDHAHVVAEFVKAIREDRVPAASAEQGYVIMKIIEAIYESARRGREIVVEEGY